MALNNLGLGFIFTARDLASGTIRQVGAGFGEMDRNASRASQSYSRNFHVMGAGLAVMGAGAATLAGAFALAHDAAAFQQEIARVGAVSNASSDDLLRLHDAALAAGSSTQFDPTASAQGLGVLAQQGLDASVAASGVSSALTFMSSRAEKIHDTLGIDLVETLADGTQRFRPFMDIAMEAGQALETHFANPAERTAAATELFSRFGVGAVEGVFHSLQRGVTDAQGRLYQGAAAVNFLREQMRNAGGTAEHFREQLLATFAGQMTLLHSAATTLKTVLGEGFADAFR